MREQLGERQQYRRGQRAAGEDAAREPQEPSRPAQQREQRRDCEDMEARLRVPAGELDGDGQREQRQRAAGRSSHRAVGGQQHPRQPRPHARQRPREPDDVKQAEPGDQARQQRAADALAERARQEVGPERRHPQLQRPDQPQRPPERQHVGRQRERREDRRLHVREERPAALDVGVPERDVRQPRACVGEERLELRHRVGHLVVGAEVAHARRPLRAPRRDRPQQVGRGQRPAGDQGGADEGQRQRRVEQRGGERRPPPQRGDGRHEPGSIRSDPVDVSVVVPVLNEEQGLRELHRRICEALAGLSYEVIYVDDGSTDGSAALIEALGDATLIKLSRNFGMEVAMSAGVDPARGDYVALVHAALQAPPELLPDMLRLAREGADVVYARRIGRDEPWHKRVLATGFYKLMERLARVPYQGQAGDFRLMSRRVVDILRDMPERRRFLRGMVAWVGFEQVPVEYRRAGRHSGRGASYRSLFRLAAEAMAAFSDVPLALASIFGMAVAAVASLAALVMLLATIFGWLSASLGVWTLIVLLFLGGVQLISVGILGRYMARVHEQTLRRPLYLVDRVVEPALAERRR